jgi:hypothetical protein
MIERLLNLGFSVDEVRVILGLLPLKNQVVKIQDYFPPTKVYPSINPQFKGPYR